MRSFVIMIAFLLGFGDTDQTLEAALEHFRVGEYQESLRYFREALRMYPEQSADIYFNMAQCLTMLDSTEQAQGYYHLVIRPAEPNLASMAYNNLGILQVNGFHFQDALESFRNAMIQNPDNELARTNYELLRRKLEAEKEEPQAPLGSGSNQEEEEQEDSSEDMTPPSQPRNNPPPPSSMGEYQELIERLKKRNQSQRPRTDDQPRPQSLDTISLDQAKQLLDAMRQEEVQFLQQLPKSPVSPKKKDGKPDW